MDKTFSVIDIIILCQAFSHEGSAEIQSWEISTKPIGDVFTVGFQPDFSPLWLGAKFWVTRNMEGTLHKTLMVSWGQLEEVMQFNLI